MGERWHAVKELFYPSPDSQGQTSEAKDWRGTVVASTVLMMHCIFFLLQGHEVVGPSASGHLCMKRPWPGIARTIYGNHQGYLDIYFKPHPGMRLLQEGVFPLIWSICILSILTSSILLYHLPSLSTLTE